MNDTFAQKTPAPKGRQNVLTDQENNRFQKSAIMGKKLTIRARKSAKPERPPELPAGAGSDGCGVFHCANRTVVFPFIVQPTRLLPLAKVLCVMYHDVKAGAADCTFLFAAG